MLLGFCGSHLLWKTNEGNQTVSQLSTDWSRTSVQRASAGTFSDLSDHPGV